MDQSTPAQTVGCQFVQQYYTVLHSSPKHLHRFYTDRSTLTYADVIPEGQTVTQNIKTASGQKMIHETVMNLGYEKITTDIHSVDSQYSIDHGVVVQVTGAQQAKGGAKRTFVQTFFLAVQEKGYFVLNDILRYLLPSGLEGEGAAVLVGSGDSGVAATSSSDMSSGGQTPAVAAADSSEEESTVYPDSRTPETNKEGTKGGFTPSSAAPSADQKKPISKEPPSDAAGTSRAAAPPAVIVPSVPFVPAPAAVPLSNGVPAPIVPIVYGAPPPPPLPLGALPTVAIAVPGTIPPLHSHVHEDSAAPGTVAATSSSRQASPRASGEATPSGGSGSSSARRPPPPPPRPEGASSRQGSAGTTPESSLEPPLTEGVFIRDIPGSITVDQLADALAAFGPLAPGTLSLKVQRGRDSYAFVDFQSVESAAACLAQGIEFEGRKVSCEAKRPLIFRQAGGQQQVRSSNGPGHQQHQQHAQPQGGRGGSYRSGGGNRGPPASMGMPRGMTMAPPPHQPYPGMPAYGAHPMMIIPQGMAMMPMTQGMMEGAYAMGPPPGMMVGGGGRGRGGMTGRYDGTPRGRGGRGQGAPPPSAQMPYA